MKKNTIRVLSLIIALSCLLIFTKPSFSQESKGFIPVVTVLMKNGEKLQLADFKIYSDVRRANVIGSGHWWTIEGWPIQRGNLWQMIPSKDIQQIDNRPQLDDIILTDGRTLKGNAFSFSLSLSNSNLKGDSPTWFAPNANFIHVFGKTKILGAPAEFKARLIELKTIKKSNNPNLYEVTDSEGTTSLVEDLSLKTYVSAGFSQQVFKYPGKLKIKVKNAEVQLMMNDIERIDFPATDTFDPNDFVYVLRMKDGDEAKISLSNRLLFGYGKTKSGQIWYERLWDYAPGSSSSAGSVSNIRSINFK